MRDHIYIGSTPSDEDCAATGITHNAMHYNTRECLSYIEALRKKYGDEPNGAKLSIRWESHDFGTYAEVVCYYNDDDKDAVDYAFKCEEGIATWAEVGMVAPVVYDEDHQPKES